MSLRSNLLFSFAGVLLLSTAARSQITFGQIDNFQDGTLMSWGGGDTMSNIATGGPAGAGDRYLQMISHGGVGSGSRLATENDVQWAGNYLAANVNRIYADLRNEGNVDLSIRIVLFTAADSVRWTSTTPWILPAGGGWVHASFSLAESDLTEVAGSASFHDTIMNVESLMFRHQTGAPSPNGTAIASQMGMDNVEAAPEPATIAVLLTGAALLARKKRAH